MKDKLLKEIGKVRTHDAMTFSVAPFESEKEIVKLLELCIGSWVGEIIIYHGNVLDDPDDQRHLKESLIKSKKVDGAGLSTLP